MNYLRMEKIAKRTLYKILGQRNYLKLMHKGFYLMYDSGALKSNPAYKYNYFIKKIVNRGDYVLDLGANLGYFSGAFSRLAGNNGKVICIEPVKPFFEVLRSNLKKRKNVILYNYALGTENKTIEMILPKMDGYIHTGLARIPTDEQEQEQDNYTFEVEMKKGSELLKNLPKLDYIKCDIEGYEMYVLPEIQSVIEKFKPVLQVETWGDSKPVVLDFLTGLGYNIYGVTNNELTKDIYYDYSGDFLFIHRTKEKAVLERLDQQAHPI